ncbi:MAG: 50S ribosome-binding GTPase, partial [Phycisphaerales bacterium]
MYDLNDTIVAVSSPTSDKRAIVRITGPNAFDICSAGFSPPLPNGSGPTLHCGSLNLDNELELDAKLYLFRAPNSYTGDDVVEIHIYTNRAVTEALVGNMLRHSQVRSAGPGEFTARAYLNGKIDLAQAEAVNEIIVSSNEYQLAAAERLLEGRLGQTAANLRDELMNCLSLIEAGLDFSDEKIEFISGPEAIRTLAGIRDRLQQLLASSISCESLVDLPSVGIAGAPNAGKSSLLNTLLGTERSIVSPQHKTTRDVLTGLWTLPHCECVLFDCAGLLTGTDNILDELAQEAAVEALRNSDVVIFCVDLAKTDWDEDLAIRKLIESEVLMPVATKYDLVDEASRTECLATLNEFCG